MKSVRCQVEGVGAEMGFWEVDSWGVEFLREVVRVRTRRRAVWERDIFSGSGSVIVEGVWSLANIARERSSYTFVLRTVMEMGKALRYIIRT